MPELPPSLDLVEVTGRWSLMDGSPVCWGTVVLTPSVERLVALPEGTVVLGAPIVLPIGADGTASGMVPATDDPDIVPAGWRYRVEVVLSNGSCTWSYGFALEVPAGEGPVDLTGSTPPGPPPEPPAMCVLSVNGMTGHVTIPIGGEGSVDSVNGHTGTVILTAQDVGAVPAASAGEPGGVATLGPDGIVPGDQLPDVIGEPGPPGPEGPAGPAGGDGASAYDLAVASGFDGTVAEWLASLVGPQGPEGADGLPVELRTTPTHLQWRHLGRDPWMDLVAIADITGPRGPEGPQGEPGEQGEPGGARLRVDDLAWPQVIAHRGSRATAPENTAAAFDAALAAGARVIELDVHLAGDGALIVNHDATLARTHGVDVAVRDLFAGAVGAYPLAPAQLGFPSLWGPQPLLTLDDVFARFAESPVVWLIEVKAYSGAPPGVWEATTAAVAQRVRRWKLEDSVVVQSFNLAAAVAAVAEGLPAGYIETFGATPPADLVAQGIGFYGMRQDAPEQNLQAAVDADGVRVLVYTVNRHVERDRLLAMGVDGIVTDDPDYLRLDRAPAERDGYRSGTWPPGHLPSAVVPVRGDLDAGGLELAPPSLGTDAQNYTAVVVGHVSPVAFPRAVTVTADVELLEAGTAERSAQLHLASTDAGYHDPDRDRVDAYNVLVRASGVIDLYKVAGGVVEHLGSGTGPAPVVDPAAPTRMQIELNVNAGQVTARRIDVSPAVVVQAADTAIAPGYVGVGCRAARARFSAITVTTIGRGPLR